MNSYDFFFLEVVEGKAYALSWLANRQSCSFSYALANRLYYQHYCGIGIVNVYQCTCVLIGTKLNIKS